MTLIAQLTAHGLRYWQYKHKKWQVVAAPGQPHKTSVQIVADLASESCLAIDIPASLSRADRQLYLEQQLQQQYPQTAYRRAIPSKSTAQHGQTNPAAAINQSANQSPNQSRQARRASLFALSLEAADLACLQQAELLQAEIYPASLLLSLLAKNEPHLLVMHPGSAGLRLVYCQHGLPIFTRLVDHQAMHSMADELLRTRQHIERHHGLRSETQLAVLPYHWPADELSACQRKLASIALSWLTAALPYSQPHTAVSSAALAADTTHGTAKDAALFELARRRPSAARIISDSQRTQYLQQRRTKYVQAASGLLMLISLPAIHFERSRYNQQTQQIATLQAEIRQLQTQTSQLQAQQQQELIAADDLRQLLNWPVLSSTLQIETAAKTATLTAATQEFSGIENFAQQLHKLANTLNPVQNKHNALAWSLRQLYWQASIPPEEACTTRPVQRTDSNRHQGASINRVDELSFSLNFNPLFNTAVENPEEASNSTPDSFSENNRLAQLRNLSTRLKQGTGMHIVQLPEKLNHQANGRKLAANWPEQHWCLTQPANNAAKPAVQADTTGPARQQKTATPQTAAVHPQLSLPGMYTS